MFSFLAEVKNTVREMVEWIRLLEQGPETRNVGLGWLLASSCLGKVATKTIGMLFRSFTSLPIVLMLDDLLVSRTLVRTRLGWWLRVSLTVVSRACVTFAILRFTVRMTFPRLTVTTALLLTITMWLWTVWFTLPRVTRISLLVLLRLIRTTRVTRLQCSLLTACSSSVLCEPVARLCRRSRVVVLWVDRLLSLIGRFESR